jgi:Response regulator containing CheY-like receiver domain and AraC-type DNA-binding domain
MDILIVDDDFAVRNRIKSRIDWKSLGIGRVEESEDGDEALELCRTFRPDILISDVRMPRMSGLELAAGVRELYPDTKVVFISGYAEKEYLKSAIKLQAVSYIEKPIDMGELLEVLRFSTSSLNVERKERREVEAIQERDDAIRGARLAETLAAGRGSREAALGLMRECGLDLESNHLFVCVVIRQILREGSASYCGVLPDRVADVLPRAARDNGFGVVFAHRVDHSFAHLIGGSAFTPQLSYSRVARLCARVSEELRRFGYETSIGIGRPVPSWADLASAYRDALEASARCFFKGPNCVVHYRDARGEQPALDAECPKDLTRLLKSGDRLGAELFARGIEEELCRRESPKPDAVRALYHDLARELARAGREESIAVFADCKDDFALYSKIAGFRYLSDLSAYLRYGLAEYFGALEAGSNPNRTVARILRLIRQHYDDKDLSITMLSDMTSLSPTYLSHVFKAGTGATINDYITERRMERAKELLSEETVPLSEIAGLVGYRDGNYFARRFRKQVGQSPSEYRGTA